MGRLRSILLPGLGHLRAGRVPEGVGSLLLWLSLLSLLGVRFRRILGAWRGPLDERIALLVLLATLGFLVGQSLRWERRVRGGSVGPGARGHRFGLGSWERFRRNHLALVGLGLLVLAYLAMLLAPFLAPFGPEVRPAFGSGGTTSEILAAPSLRHLLGTDHFSQDVFSRMLYGARISLSVGVMAVALSVTVGSAVGAIAGFLGGLTDTVAMRVVDTVMAVPRMVILIAIAALFPRTLLVLVVALAFTQWPFTARVMRGEIVSLKERGFTEAARSLGYSRGRILFRHLLPNAMAPLIVVAALGVGNAILLEAGLSFLGLGVPPEVPSWGAMVAQGKDSLHNAWWVATFPGLAIATVTLAFSLVGDGLRDAQDPRLGEAGRS